MVLPPNMQPRLETTADQIGSFITPLSHIPAGEHSLRFSSSQQCKFAAM